MSKKYILETDYEIPFDKDVKYITIDLEECNKNKNHLYPFDESAAELRGAEKAWKFCRFLREECDYGEVYGMGLTDIMDMSYQDARAKYEAWQKKEAEIKVGDEVVSSIPQCIWIVTKVSGDSVLCINSSGDTVWYNNKIKKTGRHFPEVAELLKKIGGNEE